MEVLNKYPPKEKKKIGRKPKYKLEFMNMVASKDIRINIKRLKSSLGNRHYLYQTQILICLSLCCD